MMFTYAWLLVSIKVVNVLHFFKTYYPNTDGGIEQVIFQLVEGGVKYGVRSEVLSLTNTKGLNQRDFLNHRSYYAKSDFTIASTGFSSQSIFEFKNLVQKADIVHFHFPWPFMDLVHFFSRHGKSTVVTYHSDIVKQKCLKKMYAPLMHRFLNSMDCIVASSPQYFESSPILSRYADKVRVIPFGLDDNHYHQHVDNENCPSLTIPYDKYFLFIGALRYYKGLEYLLKAIVATDMKVIIAGCGPEDKRLKKLARRLRLESNVIFMGRVTEEQKIKLLNECHGFVFPSHVRSEAFGISLLEATVFSKAMIACELSTGTSYINIDGITGYQVPPGNVLALREAMLKLWNDTAKAISMGRAARLRYEQMFTVDKMAKSYADLYESLLIQ